MCSGLCHCYLRCKHTLPGRQSSAWHYFCINKTWNMIKIVLWEQWGGFLLFGSEQTSGQHQEHWAALLPLDIDGTLISTGKCQGLYQITEASGSHLREVVLHKISSSVCFGTSYNDIEILWKRLKKAGPELNGPHPYRTYLTAAKGRSQQLLKAWVHTHIFKIDKYMYMSFLEKKWKKEI